MRKVKIVLLAMSLIFLCASCDSGKTTKVSVGESALYTKAEIVSAAAVVAAQFDEGIMGECTKVKLWYDEAASEEKLEPDRRNDAAGLYSPGSSIVIYSNFRTPKNSGGFEPNSTYRYFSWILIRENEGSDWIIQNRGYA